MDELLRAEKDMKIAVIPVGYADGFRRNLSQGKGGVYIDGSILSYSWKCLHGHDHG